MIRRTVVPFVFMICLLVNINQSVAQSAVGFDFLRTLVGAKPAAMGGAFVAMPGDIHNIFYNPAGLSHLDKRQATVSYLNHLLDFQNGFLAYAQPLYHGTFAAAVNFFDYGNFEGKDINNQDTGSFNSNSLVLSTSYAQELTYVKNLSVGGSAKFVRFQIDNLSSTALAFDFGVMYEIQDQRVSFGAGVFNVGTTTSAFIDTKDDLPLNFQFGAAKQLEHLPLLVSGSVLKYKDDSVDFRIGGEFTLSEQLFLRLGYNSVGQDQKVGADKDKFAGVSFGLGFKLNTFNFDYSFSSFGEVGSLNRITLVGRF